RKRDYTSLQISNQNYVAAGRSSRERDPLTVAVYIEPGDPLARESCQLLGFTAAQRPPPKVRYAGDGLHVYERGTVRRPANQARHLGKFRGRIENLRRLPSGGGNNPELLAWGADEHRFAVRRYPCPARPIPNPDGRAAVNRHSPYAPRIV